MALPKREFGRTGLHVTQLGYGAMEVRGERIWDGRPCSDKQAAEILNAVLDAGINFIDTANDYGKSELYIGRHLRKRRGEFYLATKCGCAQTYGGATDKTPHYWQRDHLLHNISDSLMKMEIHDADVLQLHNPTIEECDKHGCIDTLKEMQQLGATKFIGISSTVPHLGEYIDRGVFDVFQIPYSALQREHENLITRAAEAGAGIIIRGGVARGEPGEGQGRPSQFWDNFKKANLHELMDPGETATAWLLRFTITHPHCHTTIVGTLNHKHLEENLRTMEHGPLPADTYAEAKRRLDAIGVSPVD